MVEQPTKAVTFVENHDYEYGRSTDSHVPTWIKPLAYSFILLRKHGYPCIFWPDLYGSCDNSCHKGYPSGWEYLELLLKLRKQFALGEENFYSGQNVAGWVRLGGVAGAKGAMAVVISTAAQGISAVRMETGRFNRRFYHFATIKANSDASAFLVAKFHYDVYGDKADGLCTDGSGFADFLAEGGTVSIWIEDGVGLS